MPAESPAAARDPVERLLERCLVGDERAWEAIVSRYRRKIYNIAYTFVGRHEEAEDLTQDIFLKIFKSLETFDRRANFQTWLISVSRNLCIDHYRSRRQEREAIDSAAVIGDVASAVQSPTDALEQQDRVRLLADAMQALSPTLRTAVMLRDIRELSYQEIATVLRLPEGTVKSRINRGRAALARLLRDRCGGDMTSSAPISQGPPSGWRTGAHK
jgi:RNA polymerase sigma-70 factor (ECF subfamily)